MKPRNCGEGMKHNYSNFYICGHHHYIEDAPVSVSFYNATTFLTSLAWLRIVPRSFGFLRLHGSKMMLL